MPSLQPAPPSPSTAAAAVITELRYHGMRHVPVASAAAVALILVGVFVSVLCGGEGGSWPRWAGPATVQPAAMLLVVGLHGWREGGGLLRMMRDAGGAAWPPASTSVSVGRGGTGTSVGRRQAENHVAFRRIHPHPRFRVVV